MSQYILLPQEGVTQPSPVTLSVMASLPFTRSTEASVAGTIADVEVRVLDAATETGPRLVEISHEGAAAVNASPVPVRAVPVIEYAVPDRHPQPAAATTPAAAAVLLRVHCEDQTTGAPMPGVRVVAFTDFAQRVGDQSQTDANGDASLRVAPAAVERLYALPGDGYWGAYRSGPLSPQTTVPLAPVDLSVADSLRHYYGTTQFDVSTGVRVGVLDTGVGPHRDVAVAGGRNTVTGEPSGDFADGAQHGTHVAGIIASDGASPNGLRGMAPRVELHAYRVFGSSGTATNYSVLKALILAATDECDIVNLSLGGGPPDEIVEEAIRDAREQGMLVVIATGNDGRQPVSRPAAYKGATPVTAMGREGTFPAGSPDDAEILHPPAATDPDEFVAAFSNIGPEVRITAPGVGVLSTLPHDHFGPMSGTSMAAPAVAGAAASLLSLAPTILAMARDRARSDAIEDLLQTNCIRRGFGRDYEGYGLPDPGNI